jgi:predicted GNAT family acetyltransferase
MRNKTYQSAAEFLSFVQRPLESNEAANSLMLGILFQLQRLDETGEAPSYSMSAPPFLCRVTDAGELVMAAVMTPPHNLVVYGHRAELDSAAALIARHLQEEQRPLPGVLGPSGSAHAFVEAWLSCSGQGAKKAMAQRIYELRAVTPPPPTPGEFREATAADLDLLTDWIGRFQREAMGQRTSRAREIAQTKLRDRDFYLWEDGGPVSMAAKARPTRHGISIGAVYTPPEFRRRGYATACVAHLSQFLLDAGWQFCALFTDLSNSTSNAIYQKIGYRPVCDFDEFHFEQERAA